MISPAEHKQLNQSVLVIGDLHTPYHHKSAFNFLQKVVQVYQPSRIVQIGDETDGHRWSMHIPSPSSWGQKEEYNAAKAAMIELAAIFPNLDLIESNHGSLPFRKAHANGMPLEFIKDYNELWGVPDTWKWHFDLTLDLPNKTKVNFHHSRGANVLLNSQRMGMNAVQGHHHEKFGVQYWTNPAGQTFWAAQTGCLVDQHSLAMHYGKNNIKRPILGCLMILNGWPLPIPMVVDKNNRWVNELEHSP